MQYLLFGLAALVAALIAARLFAQANTAALARQLRAVAAAAALAGAALLLMRGTAGYAIPLVMLALWLFSGTGFAGGGASPWRGWGGRSSGDTSRVVTDHLEVELDHATGDVSGRVLKGVFAGREISRLKPAELALLWQDCRFTDPQSAQIVEAYLDRTHATWREDMARGEAEMAQGPDGRMTRAEAAEILGLSADADEEAIRRAHRDLMLKLHPDRGGSTYLAAKINEAKDVLLTRS